MDRAAIYAFMEPTSRSRFFPARRQRVEGIFTGFCLYITKGTSRLEAVKKLTVASRYPLLRQAQPP